MVLSPSVHNVVSDVLQGVHTVTLSISVGVLLLCFDDGIIQNRHQCNW